MKICVTEFKEIDIGLELSVVALEGNQRRRCVVTVRRPDFNGGKSRELMEVVVVVGSVSRSTAERRWHSTSVWWRTGRPLLVTEAGWKKPVVLVDIVVDVVPSEFGCSVFFSLFF